MGLISRVSSRTYSNVTWASTATRLPLSSHKYVLTQKCKILKIPHQQNFVQNPPARSLAIFFNGSQSFFQFLLFIARAAPLLKIKLYRPRSSRATMSRAKFNIFTSSRRAYCRTTPYEDQQRLW